jgi:hypothetical protein
MNEALHEFRTMDRNKFNLEYNKFYSQLEKQITLQKTTSAFTFSNYNLNFSGNSLTRPDSTSIKIHCRTCGVLFFKGSDLKHRDPNFVCICKNFIKNKCNIIENDKLYCSNESCTREIGRLIQMRKSLPLYMIDIKGIKFFNPKKGDYEVFSKWQQAMKFMKIDDYDQIN